ncbi:MAG TPA: DNA/RNA helicase, partial [Kurthia sp.]
TTTILERGITIFNLQVAVVGAENRIFDQAALIQISGRVGRSKEAPSGDVIFFHDGLTRQMDFAVAEIKRLNRL